MNDLKPALAQLAKDCGARKLVLFGSRARAAITVRAVILTLRCSVCRRSSRRGSGAAWTICRPC